MGTFFFFLSWISSPMINLDRVHEFSSQRWRGITSHVVHLNIASGSARTECSPLLESYRYQTAINDLEKNKKKEYCNKINVSKSALEDDGQSIIFLERLNASPRTWPERFGSMFILEHWKKIIKTKQSQKTKRTLTFSNPIDFSLWDRRCFFFFGCCCWCCSFWWNG